MFFVFFTFWKEHDYSCSWYPTNPSKRESKTKTESTNLRLNRSNPCEKKKIKTNQPIKQINPSNANQTKTKSNRSTHQRIWNQNQIKPIKQINPSNANQTKTKSNRSTHLSTKPNQTHQTDQPIKCKSNQSTHLSLWISEGGGHYHDGGGAWWRRRPSLWALAMELWWREREFEIRESLMKMFSWKMLSIVEC